MKSSKKPFGSGYFGEWIKDEHGLPAYRYTCNQINDPKAITPMNEVWRLNTDHIHQVGNDRLVGVASNYGYIQVRQDEGSPKYLNEYDPNNNQYAGGFGYLTDGNNYLSTFYPGNGDSFERIFGIGYFQKIVEGNRLKVDQVVFAPFGDDPILISQVKITNNRDHPVNLQWIEYWGCWMYQFALRAYGEAMFKKNVSLIRKIRRQLSKEFSQEFTILKDGSGLKVAKYYKGRKENIQDQQPKSNMEDNMPPVVFLSSLDRLPNSMSINAIEFFGAGGVESPNGLNKPFDLNTKNADSNSAMLIKREIYLDVNESKTLFFAYGYLNEDVKLELLLNRYKENLKNQWAISCVSWKRNRIKLSIPDNQWIDRELTWHNYYLRGALTYDSYFKEHILSQGHVYQYIIGFQGAARDPLQHVMPFIYCKPILVKQVIRYTLKTINKKGEIPYGITGFGQIMPVAFKPSDLELWLLWCCSEYVLATRDTDFLKEEVPSYPIYKRKTLVEPIKNILLRCYNHFTKDSNVGQHGLQRISNGDWNDGAVLGHVPEENHEEVRRVGESVLNAAMATYVLDLYSEMLRFIGDDDNSENVRKYAEAQRKAVRAQWMGKWFRRAWLTEELGWIGEDQLWLEPQPWAIIGSITDIKQSKILAQTINKLVRTSEIGARLISKGIDRLNRELGMRVNGGIWPSINGTLIWALSLVDRKMAWEEWKKNSLAVHAESFPDIWYGIWSGPDTYNSDLSKYPGQTHFFEYYITKNQLDENHMKNDPFGINWTDFPVLNLHPHAWPLFNIIHLIGARFTNKGLELSPKLPEDIYKISSPIIGFEKSKEGYSGWYAPVIEGIWEISLTLGIEELNSITSLKINDKEVNIEIIEDRIIFRGKSEVNNPLIWKIKK